MRDATAERPVRKGNGRHAKLVQRVKSLGASIINLQYFVAKYKRSLETYSGAPYCVKIILTMRIVLGLSGFLDFKQFIERSRVVPRARRVGGRQGVVVLLQGDLRPIVRFAGPV